jgi:hypothetical protein
MANSTSTCSSSSPPFFTRSCDSQRPSLVCARRHGWRAALVHASWSTPTHLV